MNITELKNIGLEVQFHNPLGIFTLDDFSYLYTDPELRRIASNVSLYLILQRPCLVFRRLKINAHSVQGEIYQPFTKSILKFVLPLYQNDIIEGEIRNISFKFAFNKYLPSKDFIKDRESLDNIELITINESTENGGAFIKLLTPDGVLERWYKDLWKINIEGETRNFLKFDVVYIGHSVKQFIADRIKNHSNIQRILTRRTPIQLGMHPSKELCICLLEIADVRDIRNISNLSKEEAMNYLSKKNTPNEKSIYYDAEKALIMFFNSARLENESKYPKYPASKDGLYEKNYPIVAYSIQEEINLVLDDKNLKCGKTYFDSIVVNRNLMTIEKVSLSEIDRK